MNAAEEFKGFPCGEYFNEFLSEVVSGVLHGLEHNSHYEAQIVLKVFDVLALDLLDNTVHNVQISDLLLRLRLRGLGIIG